MEPGFLEVNVTMLWKETRAMSQLDEGEENKEFLYYFLSTNRYQNSELILAMARKISINILRLVTKNTQIWISQEL